MNLGFLSSPNRWAYFMISLLLVISGVYITWHLLASPGSKNIILSSAQQADIQSILAAPDSAKSAPVPAKPENPANNEKKPGETPDNADKKDPTTTDSTKTDKADPAMAARHDTLVVDSLKTDFDKKRYAVYQYIIRTVKSSGLNDKERNLELWESLKLLPDGRSLLAHLNSHPIKVYSPFHLNDRSFIWELICWALFGVLCNIFYRVSEAFKGTKAEEVKNPIAEDPNKPGAWAQIKLVGEPTPLIDTTTVSIPRRLISGFDPAEVPSHIAKILYTPFIVIIMYLSVISFGNNSDLKWAQFGEGIIVFAFVLGFFSGRMVDLLDRIKDLIIPLGRFDNPVPKPNPNPNPEPDSNKKKGKEEGK